VVLGDADASRLHQVAATIAGDVLAVPADVRDEAATRALVQAAVQRHGSLDVVCTIAGVFAGPERPLEETGDDVVDRLLDVNVKGVIRVLRAALPDVRDGGAIVLTSSISGLVAHPGAAAYAASKTAQLGLARSLAAELSPRRIRVNVVCPGTIDTPMAHAGAARRLRGRQPARPPRHARGRGRRVPVPGPRRLRQRDGAARRRGRRAARRALMRP
jgi:NAD(P)-dependent dehydrogenase (short-subunit alcohol dehydrogenase family)